MLKWVIRKFVKFLVVIFISYSSLAWASVVQEDAIAVGSPQDVYVSAYYAPNPPESAPRGIWSNCVLFAKLYLGRSDESWGIAEDIVADADSPAINRVVLTNEGPDGHVAVITGIASGSLLLLEANYIPGQISTRSLPVDSALIRGYKK